MKAFSIILMAMGFLLFVWGMGLTGIDAVIGLGFANDTVALGIVMSIFGSTLLGSGVISLAITLAVEKITVPRNF
ncbi:MAG: hypothetical protein FWC50_14210 [Planctomycetaceae bacterium]|nr:hypothetical protein [Planctomycetaceae bacterium]